MSADFRHLQVLRAELHAKAKLRPSAATEGESRDVQLATALVNRDEIKRLNLAAGAIRCEHGKLPDYWLDLSAQVESHGSYSPPVVQPLPPPQASSVRQQVEEQVTSPSPPPRDKLLSAKEIFSRYLRSSLVVPSAEPSVASSCPEDTNGDLPVIASTSQVMPSEQLAAEEVSANGVHPQLQDERLAREASSDASDEMLFELPSCLCHVARAAAKPLASFRHEIQSATKLEFSQSDENVAKSIEMPNCGEDIELSEQTRYSSSSPPAATEIRSPSRQATPSECGELFRYDSSVPSQVFEENVPQDGAFFRNRSLASNQPEQVPQDLAGLGASFAGTPDPPPVASEGRARDAPQNRGKKGRQPDKSMPLRVWVPQENGTSSWRPITELSGQVRARLIKAFDKLTSSPRSRKTLWARWQDPINRPAHYDECISNGLIAKNGQVFAQQHQACEYCIKRELPCALLHQAQPDFIGILPLPASLREGYSVGDVEYWMQI